MFLKKRSSGFLFSIIIVVLFAGCASTKRISSQQSELDNLKREIAFLKDQNSKNQRELEDLSNRIAKFESSTHSEKADWASEFEDLRQQLDAVKGQFEDINYRITALSQRGTIPGVRNSQKEPVMADSTVSRSDQSRLSDDSRELYNTAYRDLIRGNYQLALHGFRQFMQQYPNTDLSDNAQYWLGEVFYAQGRYADAIQQFEKVLKWYRTGDKTPSAMLKIGYAYFNMNETEQGKLYLEEVIKDYPDSDEANLAKGRLAALK